MSRPISALDNVILNEKAFFDSFMPERIIGRENELSTFTTLLEVNDKKYAERITVYGPPGVGKSLLLRRARMLASNREEILYVPVKEPYTHYLTLYALARATKAILSPRGYSGSYILNIFLKRTQDKVKTVILDLTNPTVYTKVSEDVYSVLDLLNNANFNVVFATHEKKDANIEISKCTNEEAFLILRDRAEVALTPSSWDEGVLWKIVSQTDGNLRKAMLLLFFAAQMTTTKIDGRVLLKARRRLEDERFINLFSSLSENERLILLSIYAALKKYGKEKLISGVAYEFYANFSKRLGRKTTTPRNFIRVVNELSNLGFLKTQKLFRGVHGNTTLYYGIDAPKRLLDSLLQRAVRGELFP
ncbi:MAG: hypothetical protein NZ992_00130 [Candidatus Korarchaeum sp.]|nr:hypothetical protein [Candidatus Korarchaeum sp.]MDW8093328.1 hypothetical protein [Nitrososphaerota archaeon]